jgi:hypothetical protein
MTSILSMQAYRTISTQEREFWVVITKDLKKDANPVCYMENIKADPFRDKKKDRGWPPLNTVGKYLRSI